MLPCIMSFVALHYELCWQDTEAAVPGSSQQAEASPPIAKTSGAQAEHDEPQSSLPVAL